MRFDSEIVLFVSCSLLGYVPGAVLNDIEYPRKVTLGNGGKYFSFVGKEGALSKSYEDAETMCENNGGTVWDINVGEALKSGGNRADLSIAKSVLTDLRNVPEVKDNQLKDEVTLRLNVVFGNRKKLPGGQCKWYLAGPYTEDFYSFTFYDECPKQNALNAPSWFICEPGNPTEAPEPTETTTKEPVTDETITWTTESITTTTPKSTTRGTSGDPIIIENITRIINTTDDTGTLIEKVTDDIKKLDEPFEGLKKFQEDLVKRIVELVRDDPGKAHNATRDLFSETVPTLASKMDNRDDYVSVLKFVSNITSRIAVFTDAETKITNRETKSAVLYLLQHFKLGGNRTYNSQVRTSTVKAEYTGGPDGGTILTTHMEFRNKGLQEKMIKASYKPEGTEKFSSDLVEFFMRFKDGTGYNTSVDLFFEAETMQAKRVAEHECVFFNIERRMLDGTGCEFKELTPDGKIHCHCNHTTTFGSVFLPTSFDPIYEMALDIVSYILDCFSLSALLLSILVFSLVRQIRTVLTVIHLNLCICLFAAELIIVAHNCAHLISAKFKCYTPLGMLIHYSFLTVIAWSTLEGIYILQLMIVVFKPPESHTRFYLLFGYLLPVIFPLIAALSGGGYKPESGQLCFLDKENPGLFWTFLGPLVIMLCVNLVAISAVVYRLCTINRNVKTVRSELLRYLRGVVCMSALLGLQWGLGVLSLSFGLNQQGLKFTCILLFVFFTLLQGPLIFVVHIMLVKDTRYAVARYLAKRGRWSRCVANYIRPPPPATETHLQQGSSSTRTTEVASSNHSSSAPQTPLELNAVTTNPL